MIRVNTKLTKTEKNKLSRAATKFCRDWLRSEGYRYFMADPWDFDQNSDYCPDCMAEERK